MAKRKQYERRDLLVKKIEQQIEKACLSTCSIDEVIKVETMLIHQISEMIRKGCYSCLECELQALTYHSTIKLYFSRLKPKEPENATYDEGPKIL